MTSAEIGAIGEEYTAQFLISKGCDILARNFRIRRGELDIVAKKGNLLHIVEVKTRKAGALSSGDEAITPAKIERIIRAARVFTAKYNITCGCIFDVAIVEMSGSDITGFRYIQRAFTA